MEEKLFRRRVYDDLLEWKRTKSKRYALLIEGARRVGKTTLVRSFAEKEYDSYLFIDFSRPRDGTIDIFEKFYADSTMLFGALEQLYGVELVKGRSLVVFDEVQNYPRARALIKHLVEEGDYSYVETGSLISIRQNVENIQIPSEEHRITLNPMTFEEFLWATGARSVAENIGERFAKREPMGREFHEIAMERFKTYLLVGGMPQVVSAYVRSGRDMNVVEEEKQGIIDLYRQDMMGIRRGNGIHAAAMFESVPAMLSRHSKAVSPKVVGASPLISDYDVSMDWLCEAKICNRCRDVDEPSPALRLSFGRERYKCYLLDTGLLMTLAFDKGVLSRPDVYLAFVRGRLSMNEGMVLENAVAQMLVSEGIELHYFEFKVRGDDRHLHEVDFLVPKGTGVVPVEVKSAVSSRHASLDRFLEKYSRVAVGAVVVHTRDLREDGGVTYIPAYMAPWLARECKASRRRSFKRKPD